MAEIADSPEGRALRAAINIINTAISANNEFMMNNTDDEHNIVQHGLEYQLEAYVSMKKLLINIMATEGLEYPGFIS